MSAKTSNKPAQRAQPSDADAKPDRSAVRAAHLAKFDWSRQASADPQLSQAAKHLAARMAIDKFGTNGTAKATQRELAKICGVTTRTIRTATNELTAGYYWEVEQLGGANRYSMIKPAERAEIWRDEEQEFVDKVRRWDAAKQQWEYNCGRWVKAEAEYFWLQAEEMAREEFTMPIFEAVSKRAAANKVTDPYGFAIHAAEHWWHWENRMHSHGWLKIVELFNAMPDAQVVELATRKGFHDPWAAVNRGEDTSAEGEDTSAQGEVSSAQGEKSSAQAEVAEPLTSANNDSHKYFQVCQDEESTPNAPAAARSATPARSAGSLDEESADALAQLPELLKAKAVGCQLCNASGFFLDVEGYPVELPNGLNSETIPVQCHHNLADNLAAIRHLTDDGFWELTATGWAEIDSHFPDLAGVYYDAE